MAEEFVNLPHAVKMAVKMYDEGAPLYKAAAKHGVSQGTVLHAVAVRNRENRQWPQECEACGFCQKDRPCVLPAGMCELGRLTINREKAKC